MNIFPLIWAWVKIVWLRLEVLVAGPLPGPLPEGEGVGRWSFFTKWLAATSPPSGRGQGEGHTRRHLLTSTLTALLLLTLAACDPSANSNSTTAPIPPTDSRRIVCLNPALTTFIAALGYTDELVGVGQYDPYASDDIPIVGNFLDIDIETLLATEPTHIIMTSSKEGIPARLQDLADDGAFEIIMLPYPFNMDAALQQAVAIAAFLGDEMQGVALTQLLKDELFRVQRTAGDSSTKSVLLVIGLDPVMALGPGSVHDELLLYVNATNAAAEAKVSAPTFDREALVAMQPEVILLLQPDAPDLQPDDARLNRFKDLPIPAVENDAIYLLNGSRILLPGPDLLTTAKSMAEAIHGVTLP